MRGGLSGRRSRWAGETGSEGAALRLGCSQVLVARALGVAEPVDSLALAEAYQPAGTSTSEPILPGFLRMQMTN